MATMDWSAQDGSGPATYEEFLVPAMFAPFAEKLVKDVGVKKGARVLDVACGTGAASRAAAKAAGSKGSVLGVDMGEPTLEVARAQPAAKSAAPIEFKQADAARLPVLDEDFDIVLCQQGLQFFPDKAAALAEMARALKPGGAAGIACWSASPAPFLAIEEALGEHIGPDAAAMMRSPFALGAAELGQLVAMAGFDEVELNQETIECSFGPTVDFARRAIAAGPLQPTFAAASEEVQKAIVDDVTARLADGTTDDGELRAPMTSSVAIARKQDW